MFCTLLNRSLLCWLFCFSMAPLWAEDQREPAIPGELYAEIGMDSPGMLMSADGNWACFRTSAGLGVMNLQTGDTQGIGNRNYDWDLLRGVVPVASWWLVASQLAFKLRYDGKYFLSVWSPGDKSPRKLMPIPRDMYSSISIPPVWSADGKTLYVLVSQHLPWPKSHPDFDNPPTMSSNVKLQVTEHYYTEVGRGVYQKLKGRFEKEYEEAHAEMTRHLIMAVDVASGRAGVLAKGNDMTGLYLSPDDQKLVALQVKRDVPGKATLWTRQVLADMYLLDTVDVAQLPTIDLEEMDDRRAGWFDHKQQRLTPILTDVHLNSTSSFEPANQKYGNNGNPQVSWSPDSRLFAYATVGRQSTGDVFVYDIARSELRNMTANVELAESPKSLGYGEHYIYHHNSPKFGNIYPPLWLPDGRSLVVLGRSDVWQITLDSKESPRRLTTQLPLETRRIIPARKQNIAWVDADGRLTLIAKDRNSRMDSLWKLHVDTRDSKKLADMGLWVNPVVLVDGKGERLVYSGQTAESARNIYQVVKGGRPERITGFRLHLAERRYPQSRILKWQKENDETGLGLLYLPAGASPANKTPMILDGYPGRYFSRLDRREKDGIVFFNDALHGLLQEGFAVLYPDIEMSNEGIYERPMQQIVSAVLSATDAAVATGVIDADRLGIKGGSYGGYMVQAVIAKTDRFKAATSWAGLSDLYGDYAAGGHFSREWSEVGQGRMGVAPWVDPQRYTENSPMSYFDQVKTPLLLMHGERDGVVTPEMSRQSFRALQHLKNPTVFASYNRGLHFPTQEVGQRIQLWFREHLLGGEAVAGLADQGSFFLGGSLAEDQLVSENKDKDSSSENKSDAKSEAKQ